MIVDLQLNNQVTILSFLEIIMKDLQKGPPFINFVFKKLILFQTNELLLK